MSIEVKICGITTEDALHAAIEAGADYAGFVFFPRSPRNIARAEAARLALLARGRIRTVALTVNAPDEELLALAAEVRPDFMQLHGDESVERILAIKDLIHTPVIKAVKVGKQEDIVSSAPFEAAAGILLFDAHVSSSTALPGGNGAAFEWEWLRKCNPRRNFMLSGGLNPDNVRAAIEASGATAADVSSGVEVRPGVKSPDLIRSFTARAKACVPSQAIPEEAV